MGCGCCLLATVGAFVPRLVLVFLWIFTEFVDRAFDSWVAPLVGLVLLPYTTLGYVAVYSTTEGVSGFGWFIVILAFLVDLGQWASGPFSKDRRITV